MRTAFGNDRLYTGASAPAGAAQTDGGQTGESAGHRTDWKRKEQHHQLPVQYACRRGWVGLDQQTKDIDCYKLENLVIWDTPGFGDSESADREYARQIINKLEETDVIAKKKRGVQYCEVAPPVGVRLTDIKNGSISLFHHGKLCQTHHSYN